MKIKKNVAAEAAKALVKKSTAEVCTPEVMMDNAGMVRQIREDMANAELGAFCRLRAGIGLQNLKELSMYGEFNAMCEASFPGKSNATLKRYRAEAVKFLTEHGIEAKDAYDRLMAINVEEVKRLIAVPESERKLLPEKGVAKKVALDNRLTNAIVSYAAGDEAPAPAPKAPARISKEEEMEARKQYALNLSWKAHDWSCDAKTIRTLDTETLERVQAEFTLVVSQLKKELREREANGVK